MKKLLFVILLLASCLAGSKVFAANIQSIGFVDVYYRSAFNNSATDKLEIVKATTEYTILKEAGPQKIKLKNLSAYVQAAKPKVENGCFDEKNIPQLLERLKSSKVDYYIVGYVNSIGRNNEVLYGALPTKYYVGAENNGDTVHVNLSLLVYSATTKKVIFRATGRGESDVNNITIETKDNSINIARKSVYEQQLHNALRKAALMAAQKIAKVV